MIESYELAFRMQGKVPELLDISQGAAEGARRLRRQARARPAASPASA